jgi:MFS family permease
VIAADKRLRTREEWRSSWTLVLSCFVGFSFLSIVTGSLSMFMQPIATEFGWSRTLISSGFMLGTVMSALLSPVFGVVVDRYGSRRVALPGIVVTSIATASFALANGSVTQWFVLWAVYAALAISVKPTVWTAAVAAAFQAGRGLALGVTLCGLAATQTILPPLSNWLINAFGWRSAYIWLGFGWGAVTLLFAWFFLVDPHRIQRSTKTRLETEVARTGPELPGLTMRQALRDRALWRIAVSTLLIMLLTVGLTIHQIPILGEAGVTRSTAALLAGSAGIAAIAGKLITGVLLDHFRPNWVGGLTLAAAALAFGLLIDGIHSPALIIFAMLVNGYTQGTKVQIVSYLTARYAGMRHFGAIFGFMNSVMAAGSGVGPVLAGLIYDHSGSYSLFLMIGTVCSLLCGILLFTLPAYPDFENDRAHDSLSIAG